MQITVSFIYVACDWRPRGDAGTVYMHLAATRVQIECDWRPIGYNLNVTGHQSHAAVSTVQSRQFFESMPKAQLFELKNEETIKKV
jgi:hypothetical protein